MRDILKLELNKVTESYNKHKNIKKVSIELGYSESKIRKLLTTANINFSKKHHIIKQLFDEGYSVKEIANKPGSTIYKCNVLDVLVEPQEEYILNKFFNILSSNLNISIKLTNNINLYNEVIEKELKGKFKELSGNKNIVERTTKENIFLRLLLLNEFF